MGGWFLVGVMGGGRCALACAVWRWRDIVEMWIELGLWVVYMYYYGVCCKLVLQLVVI